MVLGKVMRVSILFGGGLFIYCNIDEINDPRGQLHTLRCSVDHELFFFVFSQIILSFTAARTSKLNIYPFLQTSSTDGNEDFAR